MSSKGGSLTNDGRKLSLIGAVIAFIFLALSFVPQTQTSTIVSYSLFGTIGINQGGTLGIALTLLFIFILYFIAIQRINIGELVIEGILVLILGLLIGGIGGLFAAFGGILIILDAIF